MQLLGGHRGGVQQLAVFAIDRYTTALRRVVASRRNETSTDVGLLCNAKFVLLCAVDLPFL